MMNVCTPSFKFIAVRADPPTGGNADRGRDAYRYAPTGWPEVVAHPRLPQNVACGFPALRSSDVDSQCGDSLQLPVGEIQLWSKQWELFFDPMELLPPDRAMPAPTAQHFAPVTLYGPMDPQQCPK